MSASGAGRAPIDQVTDGGRRAAALELRAHPRGLRLDVEAGEHELHLVAEAAELVDADLAAARAAPARVRR